MNVDVSVVSVEVLSSGGAVIVGVNPEGSGNVVVEMTPLVVDDGDEEPGGRDKLVVSGSVDVRLGIGSFGAPLMLSILCHQMIGVELSCKRDDSLCTV